MIVKIGPYPENCEDEREIYVQIDHYDTWSMDYTLSHIIYPMLIQLKETKHSAPIVDLEDTPKVLHPPVGEEVYGPNGETDINFFRRWDWVLDEMIWAFKQIKDAVDNLQYSKQNLEIDQKRRDNAFRLFGKYFQALWD